MTIRRGDILWADLGMFPTTSVQGVGQGRVYGRTGKNDFPYFRNHFADL